MMDNQKSLDFNPDELKIKNVFNDKMPSPNNFKNEIIPNNNLEIKEEINIKKEFSSNNDGVIKIEEEIKDLNDPHVLKSENQLNDQILQRDLKNLNDKKCNLNENDEKIVDSKDENDKINSLNEIKEEISFNEVKEEVNTNKLNENEPKDFCENYVNFAIICSFFQQFGTQIGVNCSIETLKNMLENENKVENNLIELHVKLLRKIKKYVNKEKWENGLVKFLYEFSYVDAFELEKYGYQGISLKLKIDLLKNLLEAQFDNNQKFKSEINNIETLLLRLVPIGRDFNGNQYWYHLDEEHTLRIYKEKPDNLKTWNLICQDKDEFTKLIDDVENHKTEACEVSSSTENSENEEENKTEVKNISSTIKDKNKEFKSNKTTDKNEEVEKKTRGRKSSKNIQHEKKELVSNTIHNQVIEEPKSKEKKNSGKLYANELISQIKEIENLDKNDSLLKNVNGNDEAQLIQETLKYLLDQVEKKLNSEEASTNFQKNESSVKKEFDDQLLNESFSKTLDSTTSKDTPKSRGRKKKNISNELSKLIDTSVSNDLSDFLPVKRSSRIQKLQEKKKAELEAQIQFEQNRLSELKKNQKLKKKDAKVSEPESEDNGLESDVNDEDYQEPIKKKQIDASSDSEFDFIKSKKKKKGKRSKKDKNIKFDKKIKKDWSSNEEEEIFEYEEDEEVLKFDENHDEFACEELEEDEEPVILKRARTAKKVTEEENDEECINDDTPCQKCNLYDNPEWILLCDNCNLGYHTACLLPKLYLIPDGDWFCPKCENEQLLAKLKFEFDNYVQNLAKREREKLRKERLKYVEINLGNILTDDTTSNRKLKTNKKRVYNANEIEFDDSDEDEEEEDDEDNDFDDNEDYNENSSRRKKPRVKDEYKRSVQKFKQRKRRRSYTDESQESQPSESGSQSEDDNSSNSDDSQPKQRSARKRVSYQFKEYDELINSAIQASDFEENDNEADEDDEEDEEEEYDSDNAKHPYSKGKDIANLLKNASEDPFNPVEKRENKIEVLQKIEEEDSKIKEEEKDKKKNKLKSKRKLNDLDSPVEEAEEDSDFTIKDESNTEFEDEEEEDDDETEDYSNNSDDNSNLSDWGKKSKKSRSKNKSKSKRKKNKRYNSDDEYSDDDSDYGYKTRKKSKRVSYREVSSTEEEDYSEYSDKSENDKKSKKNKKKRKKASSEEFSELSDSNDERAVIKKKKSKPKKYSSEDESLSKSSDEDNKRKSKRTSKKKVYNDYTDIDESQDDSNSKLINESESSLVIETSNQSDKITKSLSNSEHQETKKTPKVKIKLNKSNIDSKNSCLVSELVENESSSQDHDDDKEENEDGFLVKSSKNEKKGLNKKSKKPGEIDFENPKSEMNLLTSLTPDKIKFNLEKTDILINKDTPSLLVSNLEITNNLNSKISLEEKSFSNEQNKLKSPRASKVLNTSAINILPTPNVIVGSNYNTSSLQNPIPIISHPTQLSTINTTQQSIPNPQTAISIHHQHQAIPHHPIHNAQHPSSTAHYAGLAVPHPHQPNHPIHPVHHYQQAQHSQSTLASSSQGIHSQASQNQHLSLPPHLASLPPQIATQLASQHQQQLASQIAVSGFGIPGYPPHFYDPSFAYFGHHQSPYHHPMSNPYHPSFVPRPSQVPSTHPSIISSSLENRSPVTTLPRSSLPSNQQQSLLINSQTSHQNLTQSNSKPTSNSNRT